MKIQELKQAKYDRPFQPFRIRMADGREIEIKHPDAVSWDRETNPRMVFCLAGGEHHWVDLALVTSLVLPERAEPPNSNDGASLLSYEGIIGGLLGVGSFFAERRTDTNDTTHRPRVAHLDGFTRSLSRGRDTLSFRSST